MQYLSLVPGVPDPVLAALIAVVGAVAVALLTHGLAKRREVAGRHTAAYSKFCAAIETAIAPIPPASKHWGSETLSAIPGVCASIHSAIAEISPFLSETSRTKLLGESMTMKHFCENGLRVALSGAEILYGKGAQGAQTVKVQFHTHVKALLSHAKET